MKTYFLSLSWRLKITLLLVVLTTHSFSQILIINEVSNGPAGNQEYVELVVADTAAFYSCGSTTPPCIDIRGWIFDDNSGYHGASGVASGAVRFSNNALWSCVPLGTIILIYNNGDPNTSLPANDLSLADGNCRLVVPINSPGLFESNGTTPGAVACSYPAAGWTPGGNWNNTLFANPGDCARIVNLAGCEAFAVCWGSDNLFPFIYFTGSGADRVWFFNNGDPSVQSNWTQGCADPSVCGTNQQTPGAPNNAANAAYIAQFNNGCAPITPINVTASFTNAGCVCDGTATANPTGSIPGYTYIWYDAAFAPIGQTGVTATGLCGGTYHVIVTSSIGCSDTATVTIGSSGGTPVVGVTPSTSICNGTGTTLTANGATTYTWSPATGLSATTGASVTASPTTTTTYTVTGTTPCGSATATTTITVNPVPVIGVSPAVSICNGAGTTLSATGGTTYTWSPATGLSATTGASVTASPTTTTTYTVTGTSAGCSATASVTVTVNPTPVVNVAAASICVGDNAILTATGASSYTWSPATGLSATTGTSVTANPATTITYTVTGTSAASCVGTTTVTVTVNPIPTINVPAATICNGSSTPLNATGAATYTWSPATGLSATTGASVTASPSTTTTYTVTGTSAAGCVSTTTVTVTVNPVPVINVGNASICAGDNTLLTATGATTYTWSPATGLSATTGANVTADPSSTTTYTIIGTTAGCSDTTTATVTVNPLPNVTVNNATTCPGVTVTLTASGASTYTWSPAAGLSATTGNSVSATTLSTTSYTVTGTDGVGCSNSAVSTITVNPFANATINPQAPLCANDASVTLTAVDAGGTWTATCGACINAASGSFDPAVAGAGSHTITYTLTGSCGDTSSINIDVNPVPDVTGTPETICSGQTTNVVLGSAVAGTNFSWTVSPTNVSGASNSSGTTITQMLDVIAAPSGTVTYTITPTAAGCTGAPLSVLVTVQEVSIDNVATTDVSCNGLNDGSITITATGASEYSIDGGTSFQVSNVFSGLAPGTYAIVARNPLGCSTNSSVTVNEPAVLTVSLAGTSVGCSCNGTATATPAGGTTPYTYAWTNGDNTVTADSLCVNAYSVIVTDDNGCTVTDTINITGLPALTINTINQADPLCNGGNDGSIDIIASATATQFSIDGGGSFQATGTFTGLVAGTYNILVQDASGCQVTDMVTLSQPTALVLNTSADVTICAGQSTILSANASGGTTPYTFTWDNGLPSATSHTVSPAVTTTYSVFVTDNNGCVSPADVITVTVPTALNVLATGNQTICPGTPALISALASGGSAPYTYAWTDAGHTMTLNGPDQTVSPTTTTVYIVTVTDACGASPASDSVTVSVHNLPQVSFTVDTAQGCSPLTVTFTNTSDTSLFNSFSWDMGDGQTSLDTAPQHVYTIPGCYDITLNLVSNDGCAASVTLNNMVCVYGGPLAEFTYQPVAPDVFNPEVIFANLSNGAIAYEWDFGGLGTSSLEHPAFRFPSDSGGMYQVCLTAYSNMGCLDTTCHLVNISGYATAFIPNAFTPDGDGLNDYFYPVLSDVSAENFYFRIFNRWGQLIFESLDLNKPGWDGMHNSIYCKTDTYVWKLRYREKNGVDRELIGHVNLLR